MVRAFVVATLVVVACIPRSRSEQFACETQADCQDGRVCTGGYCVVDGNDPPPPDMPAGCPAACDTCNVALGTCTIACREPGECAIVECPTGYECDIVCETDACNIIDCTDAVGCKVDCRGESSCPQIACGTGYCDIECDNNACGQINCSSSCACDVNCQGASCATQTCPVRGGDPCTDSGNSMGDCTSSARGCDTCP